MAQLARSKRRAYLTLLVGSVLVLVLALVTRAANDAFVVVVYPILIGVYVVVLFATHRLSEFWTKIAIIMVTGGGVMLRLVELLVWRPDPLADRLLPIVGGHYWAFAVTLLVCFLLFDRQIALRVGIGLLLTSAGLVLFAILRDAAADQLTTTVVVYFLRLHLLLAILLAIVAGAAALQSQLLQVIKLAEVFAERSRTDPLTGVANRIAGNERLVTESEDAQRRAPLALAAARPHGLPVTATFGVAEHLGHEGIKDLLARADAALYEGKNGRRDQVVLAGGQRRDMA
ncbi:hypothetical protein [Thiorhodospira sibirica]|uniref:hypothetical protein n=1 Tax=Thiorhodospira sibirica TaxID=154347 RepID=UPI00022C5DBD|nr:hypothetical protein [Thiorhodospira sibirica]